MRSLDGEVGLANNDVCTLQRRLQRNRIASSRLSHGLRVDRCRAVFADDLIPTFVETYRAADLAGNKNRRYLAIRLLEQKDADFLVFNHRGVTVQLAV